MSTAPKPFVFVLMPFDPKFNDIYKFGIKGAADEVGAYAERIDEQIFTEGILERIFNQIAKADVIVADMTGRNPNVFYEVGYAHALGKIVLLLTQNSDDIPFDLKHKQHTVYGGKIELLRSELVSRLQWAISESKRQLRNPLSEQFSLRVNGVDIAPHSLSTNNDPASFPAIKGQITSRDFDVPLQIRNDSVEAHIAVTHAYLFTKPTAKLKPGQRNTPWLITTSNVYQTKQSNNSPITSFAARPVDAPDGLVTQYRLPVKFSAMPPGAVEEESLTFVLSEPERACNELCRLRLHSSTQFFDFPFRLSVDLVDPDQSTKKSEKSGT